MKQYFRRSNPGVRGVNPIFILLTLFDNEYQLITNINKWNVLFCIWGMKTYLYIFGSIPAFRPILAEGIPYGEIPPYSLKNKRTRS
jgi:hypothetical protein